MNKLIVFLGITLSSFLFSLNTEPKKAFDNMSDLLEKIKEFNEEKPSEFLYLHIDRPMYSPGDDVWFKAYLTGHDLKASTESEIVYVELITPKGTVQKQLTLLVKNGVASGDFKFGPNVPGGIYKIKAWTTWMKNFGEDFYYEKDIQVQKVNIPNLLMKLDFEKKAYGAGDQVVAQFELSALDKSPLANQNLNYNIALAGNSIEQSTATTDKDGKLNLVFNLPQDLKSNDGLLNIYLSHERQMESISRSIPIVLNDIDLQFFPEGGNFVAGIENNLAFKALNEFGKAADIEGVIYEKGGVELANFSSFHYGMGAVKFNPKTGVKYFAKITKPEGISRAYDLPVLKNKAFSMIVNSQSESEIVLNIHNPESNEVYLLGQNKGKGFYSEKLGKGQTDFTVNIPTEDAPIGVAQFTLFSNKGNAQCERLVFLNEDKKLSVSINSDKEKYLPREKVNLDIEVKDEEGRGVAGEFSLAVIDESLLSFADDKQSNILASLLLDADLNGEIEEPNFYFDEKEEKAKDGLDLVMLTNGWRGFYWKDILNENEKPKLAFQSEKKVLKGFVKNIKSNKGFENAIIRTADKNEILGHTAKDGSFEIADLDLYDPVQLIIEHEDLQRTISVYEYSDSLMIYNAIDGIVRDKKSGEPLPFVNAVFVNENTGQATGQITDLDGKFSITEIPAGAKELHLTYIGYKDLKLKLSKIKKFPIEIDMEADPNVMLDQIQVLAGRAGGVNKNRRRNAPMAEAGPRAMQANVPPQADMIEEEREEAFMMEDADANAMPVDDEMQMVGEAKAEMPVVEKDLKMEENADLAGKDMDMDGMDMDMEEVLMEEPAFDRREDKAFKKRRVAPKPVSRYYKARAYYVPKYEKSARVNVRDDFRKTIFWDSKIKTDGSGKAKVSFVCSDQVTQFVSVLEGIGNGIPVHASESFYVQMPFSIDARIPKVMTFGDKVNFDLIIKNNTEEAIEGNLKVLFLPMFKKLKDYPYNLTVPANQITTIPLSYEILPQAGEGSFLLSFNSAGMSDAIKKALTIVPKGFPASQSLSGTDLVQDYDLEIRDLIDGSLTAGLTVYPNILDDLMSGVEGLFRQPNGCFEQTSSTTYPNIVALRYLAETGKVNPDVSKKALEYIKAGYERLISYETSEHGFEWFGQTPPHEGLTAYGLMEFVDMKKVYPAVDQAVIDRTTKWLLSRRDGKGSFDRSSKALDSFGRADDDIHNAYIVYALTEAGILDIDKEFDAAYNRAQQKEDAYRMALVANAAFNLGKEKIGKTLLEDLKVIQKKNGYDKMPADHSITRSGGVALQLETNALVALADMKSAKPDLAFLKESVDFFASNRNGGRFSSTQATILVLKAMSEFAKLAKKTESSGEVEVVINDQVVKSVAYEKGATGKIEIDKLEEYLGEGAHKIIVRFKETKEALPYSLNVDWNSFTPVNSSDCPLKFETKLADKSGRVGETKRLTVNLTNKTNEGLPSTICKIGIPSGLSPQPWQLKELSEKKVVDYYEIIDNYLVCYFRQMKPSESKEIKFDLKTEVAGEYFAPASSAYLYYTDENKVWEQGSKISILQ